MAIIAPSTNAQPPPAAPRPAAAAARPTAVRPATTAATATVVLPSPAANRRQLVEAQTRDTGGQVRERLLARVDDLVRGMEQVADRLASPAVSSSQRTLLMSRFTDMERQVNEIDGIVGSEGREASGRQALSGAAAATETSPEAVTAAPATAAPQQRAAAARVGLTQRRQEVAAERRDAQLAVAAALRDVPQMEPEAAAAVAGETAAGIRATGRAATEAVVSGLLVDVEA